MLYKLPNHSEKNSFSVFSSCLLQCLDLNSAEPTTDAGVQVGNAGFGISVSVILAVPTAPSFNPVFNPPLKILFLCHLPHLLLYTGCLTLISFVTSLPIDATNSNRTVSEPQSFSLTSSEPHRLIPDIRKCRISGCVPLRSHRQHRPNRRPLRP